MFFLEGSKERRVDGAFYGRRLFDLVMDQLCELEHVGLCIRVDSEPEEVGPFCGGDDGRDVGERFEQSIGQTLMHIEVVAETPRHSYRSVQCILPLLPAQGCVGFFV